MNPTIAIIGAGNMGKSLAMGLMQYGGYAGDQLWISSPSHEELTPLKEKFNINTSTDNLIAINKAEVIILAVKPPIIPHVVSEMKEVIQKTKPLIISIAAGVREKTIQDGLGGEIAIVRAMPNTPAMIGCGATGLFANSYTSSLQRDKAEKMLNAVGITCWVEHEHQLDIVTALSGSGPAYFFLIIEALQTAAEQLGLSTSTAHLLSLQTALGAAKMAFETRLSLNLLRQQVTSKGGTTERGIEVLEKKDIAGILLEVLQAAKKRAEELSQ